MSIRWPGGVPSATKRTVYHVIYSEEKGVFLGWHGEEKGESQHWSRVNPADLAAAPTFTRSEYDILLRDNAFKDFPRHRLVEVYPDLRGNQVSAAACVRMALPGWAKQE
jgi:hypothetical protein